MVPIDKKDYSRKPLLPFKFSYFQVFIAMHFVKKTK